MGALQCAATSGSSIAALRLLSCTGMARAAGAIHRAERYISRPFNRFRDGSSSLHSHMALGSYIVTVTLLVTCSVKPRCGAHHPRCKSSGKPADIIDAPTIHMDQLTGYEASLFCA
jgi:hypothetical protein